MCSVVEHGMLRSGPGELKTKARAEEPKQDAERPKESSLYLIQSLGKAGEETDGTTFVRKTVHVVTHGAVQRPIAEQGWIRWKVSGKVYEGYMI